MDDAQRPADDELKMARDGVTGMLQDQEQPHPDVIPLESAREEVPDGKSMLVDDASVQPIRPEPRLEAMEMEVDMRLEPSSSASEVIVKTSPVDEGFPPDMGWQGPVPPPQDELDDQEQRETSPSGERPLNVGDALSYLDAVKKTFSASPTVYNKFLDIMKDFKNQTIDTPGVIQRVSSLFAGFPLLIEGFNTFLPAGYRIECSVDRDTNVITVTTPEGTTTHNQITILDDSAFAKKLWARFGGREDLYREFMDIIKDNENSAEAQRYMAQRMANIFEHSPNLLSSLLDVLPPSLADIVHKAAALDRDRRSRQSKRKAPEPAPQVSSGQKKKRKNAGRDDRATENDMEYKNPGSQGKTRQTEHDYAYPEGPRAGRSQPRDIAHSNVRTSDHTLENRSRDQRQPSADDYSFFDRVKLAIDNRETYNEFLKLINYFTQGIIDMRRLVDASRTFLNDDLMMQFKKILGWDPNWDIPALPGSASGRSEGMERVAKESLRIRQGPSYRRLPASEANVSCSGRDEMCRSVLNDEWMSHPTWSSEDGGFIGHRKNVYEEALHRSEEERHEYDFHIEAIVRTIGLLEPLNFKILQMSPEDRANFKPKLPFMNGVSKAIFQRIVKKVYGRDAGLEVIQCVYDQPAVAIPILYARLRQKDAEWKKAQKEWNKVWREVDARNYQKSLDHQGITFKAADKKAITAKTFLNQLESARDEQLSRRASLVDPTFARTRPRYHMAFAFDDIGVMQDVFKLTFSLLDRMHHNIMITDRRRIEGFLRTFIPMFFMLDPVHFGEALQLRNSQLDFPITEDYSTFVDEIDETAHPQGATRTGRNVRRAGGDLRKKILKGAQDKKKATSVQSSAMKLDIFGTSPTSVSPGVVEDTPPSSAGSVTEVVQESPVQPKEQQTRRAAFFTNASFYTLFRLVELLYSRLKMCKDLATMLANDPSSPYLSNPIASDLSLLTSESTYPKLAAIQKGPSPASQFYPFLLETCEKLFDNAIDPPVFEEILRGLFGTKAYIMFTFDKVIGALIKQVQHIITDGKSLPILDSLRREREMPSPSILDFDDIRATVEKVIAPEENLFRLDWTPTTRTMTIQLLGKDDANFDDVDLYNGRWHAYMDSFVSDATTKGMEGLNVKPPFLSRNYRKVEQPPSASSGLGQKTDDDLAFGHSALEIKICVRTYRMFFVAGTEDCMWRMWASGEEEREIEGRHKQQVQKSRAWLQGFEESGRLPGAVTTTVREKEGE